MKVYVSKKDIEENELNFIEDEFVEKYWLLRGDNEDGIDFYVHDDFRIVEIETLEQHDAEIRKQAKQEVINELLEWINKNKNDYMCRANTQHISGKSFSPHRAGASITVYTDGFVDELKQNETRTCNLDKNYLCSLCGASQADIRKKYSNFCSNCGAKIIE